MKESEIESAEDIVVKLEEEYNIHTNIITDAGPVFPGEYNGT